MISKPIIGIYDGEYCGSFYLEVAFRCIGLPYKVFNDPDINKPKFGDDLSVLIFGAGGIEDSNTALGKSAGKQKIKSLIAEGRNYIGICAGAYLALDNDPRCLSIAKHELSKPSDSNIFQGFLRTEWKDKSPTFDCWYQNGPAYSHVEGDIIARFASTQDESSDCSPNALLKASDFANRPAVVKSTYGSGKCILFSPHLEFGSLGIPKYIKILESWGKKNFPDADPNLVPIGKIRERLLEQVEELGLTKQVDSPQWRKLKDILT